MMYDLKARIASYNDDTWHGRYPAEKADALLSDCLLEIESLKTVPLATNVSEAACDYCGGLLTEDTVDGKERQHKNLSICLRLYRSRYGELNLQLQALEAENARLKTQIEELEDDDAGCWHCAHSDSGDPERHEHEPNGGHWHHYIDPGDGLPSPCKNSAMLERVFQEQIRERDHLKLEVEKAKKLLDYVWFYSQERFVACAKDNPVLADWIKKVKEVLAEYDYFKAKEKHENSI